MNKKNAILTSAVTFSHTLLYQTALTEAARIPPNSAGDIGASFLLGHAGIYAVSSLVFHTLGIHICTASALAKTSKQERVTSMTSLLPLSLHLLATHSTVV